MTTVPHVGQHQRANGRLLADDDKPSGWEPVDLEPILSGDLEDDTPSIGARTDGVCLLYREKVHAFNGEPESGKSWCAQAITVEQLTTGNPVLHLDFEDNAKGVVGRLLAVGATADILHPPNFIYIAPSAPWSLEAALALEKIVAEQQPDLVIVDGVTEAMALHGLNPYDNGDVAKWWAAIPRPVARSGAAVVLIDHVVKSTENRGKWAIGAQHKLAAIDGAAFTFEIVKPFGRGREGLAKIVVTKDRPGHLRQHARGAVVGHFRLESWGDGGVSAHIEALPDDNDGAIRPTTLMEKISRYIEGNPGLSRNAIRGAIRGKADYVRLAIELLINEGNVIVQQGPNRSLQHRSRVPYRVGADPPPSKEEPF
jgi:hypothetical protein